MSENGTDKVDIGNDVTNPVSVRPPPDLGRRQFVTRAATTAAVAGAATLGFPMIAKAAEPITLKFQTTWLVEVSFTSMPGIMEALCPKCRAAGSG